MNEIPANVLAILKNRWRPNTGYSSFDSIFCHKDHTKRRTDPSYYHIRTGMEIECNTDVLTHDEASDLVQEGVFGSLAVSTETGVSINEHAQHAIIDFCSEVYAAWEKYKRRIEEVEDIGVRPEQD